MMLSMQIFSFNSSEDLIFYVFLISISQEQEDEWPQFTFPCHVIKHILLSILWIGNPWVQG